MTERKCEWLESEEWNELAHEAVIYGAYTIPNTEKYEKALEDFIRARVEEERKDEREACARVCERRAENRFLEHGTTEPDTGATYYGGNRDEEYSIKDEEDEDCAKAIRARGGEK